MDKAPSWGDSTEWQYWVIDTVKRHEAARGYNPHPIGMTMQFPVAEQTKVNEPLLGSSAEWISPGYDDDIFAGGGHPMAPGSPPSRWYADPPIAHRAKEIISDTDHYAPGQGDALWAWKSFLRGHHPILMDFGLIAGVHQPDPAFEPARHAMGDTLRFATRMNLIAMQPRGDFSSTGYALANPGEEYLVLDASDTRGSFTVHLEPGTYAAEWFAIGDRDTIDGEQITVERPGSTSFSRSGAPGPTVLYLSNVARVTSL